MNREMTAEQVQVAHIIDAYERFCLERECTEDASRTLDALADLEASLADDTADPEWYDAEGTPHGYVE